MSESSGGRRWGIELAYDGLAAVLEHLPHRHGTLAVLTYHRVGPADERSDLHPGLRVDPGTFADQMALVVRRTDPVSIDDILTAADGGPPLPTRALHITFDDAYECIERHAWPVLKRLGLPATMFVPTSYPDQARTFWWDRLHQAVDAAPGPELTVGDQSWSVAGPDERTATFAELRALVVSLPHVDAMALVDEAVAQAGTQMTLPATSSWAGLKKMASEGLALGPHSRTHPFLNQIPEADLDEEVAGSLADLQAKVGDAARPVLAYPGGGNNRAVVAAARRAGIRLAFTTERDVIDPTDADWLRLPRINVGPRATTPTVRVQLQPAPHRVRALSRSLRAPWHQHHRPYLGRTTWN